MSFPVLAEAFEGALGIERFAREHEAEHLRGLAGECVGLAVRLCRALGPPQWEGWDDLTAFVDKLEERSDSQRRWWHEEVLEQLRTFFDSARDALTALQGHNPKCESLLEWLSEHPQGSVVGRRAERQIFERLDAIPEIRWVERVHQKRSWLGCRDTGVVRKAKDGAIATPAYCRIRHTPVVQTRARMVPVVGIIGRPRSSGRHGAGQATECVFHR